MIVFIAIFIAIFAFIFGNESITILNACLIFYLQIVSKI